MATRKDTPIPLGRNRKPRLAPERGNVVELIATRAPARRPSAQRSAEVFQLGPGLPADLAPTWRTVLAEIDQELLQTLATSDFEPALDVDQVSAMLANYEERWGPGRMIMLMSLARSKAQLMGDAGGDRVEGLVEMLTQVRAYAQHLRFGLEMADAAALRLAAAAKAALERPL